MLVTDGMTNHLLMFSVYLIHHSTEHNTNTTKPLVLRHVQHLGRGLVRLARVVRSLVTVAVLTGRSVEGDPSSELCLKSVQLPD